MVRNPIALRLVACPLIRARDTYLLLAKAAGRRIHYPDQARGAETDYDIGSANERTGACEASVPLYNSWVNQPEPG
jgi:hypothetical protein